MWAFPLCSAPELRECDHKSQPTKPQRSLKAAWILHPLRPDTRRQAALVNLCDTCFCPFQTENIYEAKKTKKGTKETKSSKRVGGVLHRPQVLSSSPDQKHTGLLSELPEKTPKKWRIHQSDTCFSERRRGSVNAAFVNSAMRRTLFCCIEKNKPTARTVRSLDERTWQENHHLTEEEEGHSSSFPEVKPRHLYRPLVISSSTSPTCKMVILKNIFNNIHVVQMLFPFQFILNKLFHMIKRGVTHRDWQLYPACDWLKPGTRIATVQTLKICCMCSI